MEKCQGSTVESGTQCQGQLGPKTPNLPLLGLHVVGTFLSQIFGGRNTWGVVIISDQNVGRRNFQAPTTVTSIQYKIQMQAYCQVNIKLNFFISTGPTTL